ncbi:MAG: hypothetical protein KME16_21970 [Scytolyngbya sp. HA4215-MV1]|jgi:hypothetical protein|nr:hypothetical protein [Scytolyngbya sp. HA4215-MV1]
MIKDSHQHGWLFRFASQMLKYVLLGLFGLGIACLVSAVLGVFPLVEILISILAQAVLRIMVVLACLLAIAVAFESVR